MYDSTVLVSFMCICSCINDNATRKSPTYAGRKHYRTQKRVLHIWTVLSDNSKFTRCSCFCFFLSFLIFLFNTKMKFIWNKIFPGYRLLPQIFNITNTYSFVLSFSRVCRFFHFFLPFIFGFEVKRFYFKLSSGLFVSPN